MILVTGATGTVGGAVLDALLTAGAKVTAMTRDPARAKFPPDVEVVGADLGRPETLPAALAGVDKVFLTSPAEHKAEHDGNLAAAARAADVRHIVLLSSLATAENPDNLLARWHLDGERAVRAAGVPVTVVRPGGFMSNALQWAESVRSAGVVRAPLGGVASAPVDPRDIAAVVAEALLGTGHEGHVYPVTGPESLTPVAQVRILSEVLGREIRFEEIPVEAAREAMARRIPAAVVDAVLSARMRATDVRAKPLPTIEEVTGRPPRTFARWVADHAAAFA
jgi:uncharacterized protein YbjT (DUF2867 family)